MIKHMKIIIKFGINAFYLILLSSSIYVTYKLSFFIFFINAAKIVFCYILTLSVVYNFFGDKSIFYSIFCDDQKDFEENEFDLTFKAEQLTFFQDPASVEMYQLITLHNNLCYYLYGILCVVLWCLFYPLYCSIMTNGILCPENAKVGRYNPDADHCELLEIVWTILPTMLLVVIGYPGLELLYQFDDNTSPELIIKVVGNQWFWTYEETLIGKDGTPYIYEYNQVGAREWSEAPLTRNKAFQHLRWDSREQFDIFYAKRFIRWLSTDVPLQLPVATKIRFIGTSEDVIHSFAVPALGIKMDVCPGRLNKTDIFIDRMGWYYGQCSEFCGVNHGFMPILISAIRKDMYWEFRKIITLRFEQAVVYKKTGYQHPTFY